MLWSAINQETVAHFHVAAAHVLSMCAREPHTDACVRARAPKKAGNVPVVCALLFFSHL